MRTQTNLRAWKSGMSFSVAVSLAVCLIATAAYGQGIIYDLSGNLGQGWVYTDGPSPKWDMHDMVFQDGQAQDNMWNTWAIAPVSQVGLPAAALTWQADLNEDLNPGGPLADATFQSGGLLTLVGDVWASDWFGNPETLLNPDPADKVLLTATVSAFRITEAGAGTNILTQTNATARITPTGGFLVTNTVSGGMKLVGDYWLSCTLANVQTYGGDIDDFQSDIWNTAGGLFRLNPVPEPATLLLLAGAMPILVRRARRIER